MENVVDQRVYVVVGGGSGLGAASAQRLARGGARVVVADLNPEAAGRVVAAFGDPARGRAAHVEVTSESSVQELFTEVLAHDKRVDGVLNCAGVSTIGRVVEHDVEEWRRVVDVCLTGAFIVLKHAGAAVADGGSLVTLSSLNARQPGVGMAAYCAAKAGVVALSEVMALELGPRQVRVNTIAPGLIVTPLTEPAMEIAGVREAYLENTALGRSGEPDEIAALAEFLLGNDSRWITGETIDINGGGHPLKYPNLLALIDKAFG